MGDVRVGDLFIGVAVVLVAAAGYFLWHYFRTPPGED
jgi:hypothetical protein